MNSTKNCTRGLNTQYVVMFKNPSDVTQIHIIGRQMYPSNSKFLADVNREATKHAHGYLFLDLRQENPEEYMVRK